jgi:hypothetical protein
VKLGRAEARKADKKNLLATPLFITSWLPNFRLFLVSLVAFLWYRAFGFGGGPKLPRKEKVPCPMIPKSD